MDDRNDKIDMAEVTRAFAGLAVAGLAFQTRIDDAQTGVHQAHVDRVAVLIISVGRDDIRRAHPADLFRRKEAELDGRDPFGDLLPGSFVFRDSSVVDKHYTASSSCNLGATPRDLISSRSSLNE